MGLGPLTAALGLALMLRLHADVDYLTDLLPALLIFSLGLSCTVAPLTAAVLSDADESNAGIASGVNNAIARIAGLLAIAAIGVVISAQFFSTLDRSLARTLSPAARAAVDPGTQRDARRASIPAHRRPGRRTGRSVGLGPRVPRRHRHLRMLVALGGVLGLTGIRNPRRVVRCADCPGGQLAGQPLDAARRCAPDSPPEPAVAVARA